MFTFLSPLSNFLSFVRFLELFFCLRVYITLTFTALGREKKRIEWSIANKKERETQATVM
jgi:hypothetical protein